MPYPWVMADARHVWHPYTQHFGAPDPVPIVRARGAYLYDAHGHAIFDAISSWWVTLHGHAHPAIAAAIGGQALRLEQVIFAGFTHEPAALLAQELVQLLPSGLTRVFFSDDGSTAVEVALKIALQYWTNRGAPRPLVAALDHAYHGDTFGAMSASGRGLFTEMFTEQLFEVARLPDPTEGDTVEALVQLLDMRGDELAALIVEPLLLGVGGMRVWNAATLQALRALTVEHGVLLIADEVLTGFGRTGPLFACERASVVPDILCLAKGLTGGFLPLGVTAVTDELFDSFQGPDPSRTFYHGHSFAANPISCAAARASLALLDASSEESRALIEQAHVRELDRLGEHPAVRAPRVLGTVAAFDLVGAASYLNPVGRALAEVALREGVLLRPLGNVVYVLPPYCSTPQDLARAYAVIAAFLEGQC